MFFYTLLTIELKLLLNFTYLLMCDNLVFSKLHIKQLLKSEKNGQINQIHSFFLKFMIKKGLLKINVSKTA